MKTAINLNNFPVEIASLGNDVIDINTFAEPYYFHDLGLKHTSFCESAICYIDGDKGLLLLRGYPIEQLAEHYDFETVIYLLLNGELPSQIEKEQLQTMLKAQQPVPKTTQKILETLPRDMHPMGTLLTLIASLAGTFEENDNHYQTAVKIIAQMPVLVAMCQRHQDGLA